MTHEQDSRGTIRNRFSLPEEVQKLSNFATGDLMYGPWEEGVDDYEISGWQYPGWSKAADILQAYAKEHFHTVWIGEENGCLVDMEPEGGYWEEIPWYTVTIEEKSGIVTEEKQDDPIWVEDEPYREYSLKEIAAIMFGNEIASHIWL